MSTVIEGGSEATKPKVTDQEIEEVLQHLEEAFDIFHLGIELKMESIDSQLPPNGGYVLHAFYEEERSHDDIAEELHLTVAEVYELRISSIQKLSEHIGRTVPETEGLLWLYRILHNHCSPEVIDQLRNQK